MLETAGVFLALSLGSVVEPALVEEEAGAVFAAGATLAAGVALAGATAGAATETLVKI